MAIVHMPPPLHGLSRASAAVVGELRRAAPEAIAVADISGPVGGGRLRRLERLPKVAGAAVALVRHRRCGRVYIACDGGAGVAFTAMLLGLAGRLGYTIHLHHHSLAQVRTPHTRLTGRLAAASRRHQSAIVHVGACEGMVDEITAAYGPGTRVFVLPLHQMSEVTAPSETREGRDLPFVLGHMSNLTESKGLGRAFDLLSAGVAAGLDLELVVAGPAWAPSDRALLDRRLDQAAGRARWLGPVEGAAKRAFFDQIDVFVFPSMYEHESFAIVVAEAQAAGKPVLSYRAGCLDAAVFGAGVLTLAVDEEFVQVALDRLRSWVGDRGRLASDSSAAAAAASRNRSASAQALEALVKDILGRG